MDEISKLRYQKKLPEHIVGCRRNSIIRQYREWKGSNHVPAIVHSVIRWSDKDLFQIPEGTSDSAWMIVDRDCKKNDTNMTVHPILTVAKGSVPVPITSSEKRKLDPEQYEDVTNIGASKKLKLSPDTLPLNIESHSGLIWDPVDWSCVYDSLFSILFNVWTTNPHKWNKVFKSLNIFSVILTNGFQKVLVGKMTLEEPHDRVRAVLYEEDDCRFP